MPVFCLMSYYNTLISNPPWLVTSGRHFAILIFFLFGFASAFVHSKKRSNWFSITKRWRWWHPTQNNKQQAMTMRFMETNKNTHFLMRLINALIKEIPLAIVTTNAIFFSLYLSVCGISTAKRTNIRFWILLWETVDVCSKHKHWTELHWKWNWWTLDLSIVLISGVRAHSRSYAHSLCHMFPIFMHFRQTLCTIIRFWRNQIQNSQIKKERRNEKNNNNNEQHTALVFQLRRWLFSRWISMLSHSGGYVPLCFLFAEIAPQSSDSVFLLLESNCFPLSLCLTHPSLLFFFRMLLSCSRSRASSLHFGFVCVLYNGIQSNSCNGFMLITP